MKLKILLIAGTALSCAVSSAAAEKIIGGPKGGRLLEVDGQKAEFFVTPDKRAEITFYDASLNPVAPGEHVVAITAEPASGRTKLELEKTSSGYVSKNALPKGEPYRVVVQLRTQPEARPQNFRVDLNLAHCGECNRAEYACVCTEH